MKDNFTEGHFCEQNKFLPPLKKSYSVEESRKRTKEVKLDAK